MRLTELMAVQNKDVEPTDQRITHLERLPRKEWNKVYDNDIVYVELPECLLRGAWRQDIIY